MTLCQYFFVVNKCLFNFATSLIFQANEIHFIGRSEYQYKGV